MKKNDYRKKYKLYYGIDFGSDYVIHHIDFDRSNNDINNLLLLPRGLHTKYHSALSGICDKNHMINGRVDKFGKYAYSSLRSLSEALLEIKKWKKWKEYKYDEYLKHFLFVEDENNEKNC